MNLRALHSVSLIFLLTAFATGCTPHGNHTTETATSPVASTSNVNKSSFDRITPAHGLSFEAPSSVTSDKQPVKDSAGMSRINYYITDETSPAIIDVEYYTEHSKTAASILEDDKKAYAEDGASIKPRETTVKGSPAAYTFSWEQSATPPWNDDTKEIDLSCQAVLSDGPSGYSYGVYVCVPKDNTKSLEMMRHIINSIEVKYS